MQMPLAARLHLALRTVLAPIRSRRRTVAAPPPGGRPYPWEGSYPPGVDWDATIEPRPLTKFLDDAVADYGDRGCISFRGKRFSYREVGDLVDRAARGFRALGVH